MINRHDAPTTIEGPAGVSIKYDANKPMITASIPAITEKIAICSGELENNLAAAAGIISSDVINNAPTICIEIATSTATKSV